jgi:hypothetical protein
MKTLETKNTNNVKTISKHENIQPQNRIRLEEEYGGIHDRCIITNINELEITETAECPDINCFPMFSKFFDFIATVADTLGMMAKEASIELRRADLEHRARRIIP